MTVVRTLIAILTPGERASGLLLVGLLVVGMMLEMLGIGIVVPALTAMSSGMASLSSPGARAWLAVFGDPTPGQIILGGLVLLFAIHLVKAGFLLFTGWYQAGFVARLQARTSEQLFRGYLTQPWSYHLVRNSGDLVRNLSETATLGSGCTALIGLLGESLVLLGLLALLVWHEPLGALAVAGLLTAAAWLLQRFTHDRLQNWGTRYWDHAGQAHRIFSEALQGAKDFKVLGREETLFERVAAHKREQTRLGTWSGVVQQLPRVWFELVAVSGLCLLTAVMVREGKAPEAMVPTLGLFAAAAFRILPSANRVMNSLQTLRVSAKVIETLHTDLGLAAPPVPPAPEPLVFRDAIRLERVSFRYDTGAADALGDVSLTIPRGTAVGIIGGSGSGKSTLVDILLGLLPPTAGRVTVDGCDIAAHPRAWQALVGYVPQTIFLVDDTLRANVALGVPAGRIDDAAVRRALAAARLDEFVAGLPEGWDTVVGERGVRLSGGQRQRIGIARALYHDPRVLVLDEATSALDNETEKGVMAAVDALHGAKTLVIIAHRLSTVANCDVLYRLEHGRVVAAGSFLEVTA